MPTRPTRAEHEATVARRLQLLREELGSAAAGLDEHTRVRRVAAPEPEPVLPPREPERVPSLPVPGRHAARRPGRLAELLPQTVRGRVGLGPGPVAVVALLLALGLAVTTWVVVRSDSTPVAPVVPRPGADLVTTPDSPSASGEGETVTVDVAGKVRRPGIAVLDAGSRVIDALRAAGGARKGVDLSGLNLARVLVDGEQVVVGLSAPAPGLPTAPGAPTGVLVNINTATVVELESLPEVGPVTAQAIVTWREEHGGFTAISELLEVDGIGEATLETITPFVTV